MLWRCVPWLQFSVLDWIASYPKRVSAMFPDDEHLFLLPQLLYMAAHWSHDTSQTFHPIIQLPTSTSQNGTQIAETMSVICVNCFKRQGTSTQHAVQFNKSCKYVYTYSIYSLLFSFVTIISDPLGFRSTWYVCNYKDKTTITIMKLCCILLLSNNILL